MTLPTHSVEPPTLLRRAPLLSLAWEPAGLVCLMGTTGREFVVSAEAIKVLHMASVPMEAPTLAEEASVPVSFVWGLASAGLIEAVKGEGTDHPPPQSYWGPFELAVHRRTDLGAARQNRTGPVPEQRRNRHGSGGVSLVNLDAAPGLEAPFSSVLRARRSNRCFGGARLSLNTMASLLNESAAICSFDGGSGVSRRPYPSGGGRHPIELYVLPYNVEGLEGVAYHYDPFERALVRLVGGEQVVATTALAWGVRQREMGPPYGPSAVLLLIADFYRTLWKYENLGLSLVYKDVGCLLQTLHLTATALGIWGFPLGGGPGLSITKLLMLDPVRHGYVGAFMLGPECEQGNSAGGTAMDGGEACP